MFGQDLEETYCRVVRVESSHTEPCLAPNRQP
jgi:hypothetical protein